MQHFLIFSGKNEMIGQLLSSWIFVETMNTLQSSSALKMCCSSPSYQFHTLISIPIRIANPKTLRIFSKGNHISTKTGV